MTYKNIKLSVENSIAVLTFDRPEVHNALNFATIQEAKNALIKLTDDDTANVLIMTGGGDKAFVSGADINDLKTRTRDDGLAAINSSFFKMVECFPSPTIAAINGYALGGGCELALACDIRIAAETAKFGQPELGLGIIPGAGATQRLPRVVGLGRAKHLILTGEIINARNALEIGLVSAVVPAENLDRAAHDMARRILKNGPLAARLAKVALNASARVDLDSGLMIETLAQAVCYSSKDKLEGMTAFLEKRAPKFTGT